MKKPMTAVEAFEKFGESFWDSTCSLKCPVCGTGNFFLGQFWKETVPSSFKCANCCSTVDGHHPSEKD